MVTELAEQLPMSQSKLVLGFRTGLPRQRRARTALRVMTALLGGSTGSRLFTNVRERLGCCYYCGARVNLLTGILLIECGLEEANRERLQSAILAEIADLAAGHITPQELSHIKLAFQSSLCSIGDSLARTERRRIWEAKRRSKVRTLRFHLTAKPSFFFLAPPLSRQICFAGF